MRYAVMKECTEGKVCQHAGWAGAATSPPTEKKEMSFVCRWSIWWAVIVLRGLLIANVVVSSTAVNKSIHSPQLPHSPFSKSAIFRLSPRRYWKVVAHRQYTMPFYFTTQCVPVCACAAAPCDVVNTFSILMTPRTVLMGNPNWKWANNYIFHFKSFVHVARHAFAPDRANYRTSQLSFGLTAASSPLHSHILMSVITLGFRKLCHFWGKLDEKSLTICFCTFY